MLPAHSIAIRDALKEELSKEWTENRGIEVVSVGIGSATASDEDEQMIKELQKKAVYRNASMGAAALVDAQAEAMKTAAGNDGGAMVGFMGMNMASVAGGASAQSLYNMAAAEAPKAPTEGGWLCACGKENTGKFCSECGSPKPTPSGAWKCACGKENTGKFCSECGAKRPEGGKWTCACGKENEGKFCAECGNPRP